MSMLDKGKLNILIGGQFGSEGKGVIASYLSQFDFDVAVSNAGPNSGHTFYKDKVKCTTQQLPVAGILNPNCIIYLCAGSVINPEILLKEIMYYGITNDRLVIHPRAAVIDNRVKNMEQQSPIHHSICSTLSGTGKAISHKTDRLNGLACNDPFLKQYVKVLDLQHKTSLMEVPQGLGLSLNSGLSYPYCTSREITVQSAMADAQVHPKFLGKVHCVIRTLPIRVANHYSIDGSKLATSGPFYIDSIETSWDELGLEPEITTVTGKYRRVASFSMIQYHEMLRTIQPDYIYLNFTNYLHAVKLCNLLDRIPEVTHMCCGPLAEDVYNN